MKINKPYIIAEIGLNHNGNINLAKKTIDLAKKSGADAVKFQSFKTEEFMSSKNITYSYNKNKKKENMYQMFKRLEFKDDWYSILKKYCNTKKIDFLTSIADRKSLKKYLKINPKIIKIASEDLINYNLLKVISKLNKIVILSSGMADEGEIAKALSFFKNKKKLILLHCVSLYPTKDNLVNLNRIKSLKKKFKIKVGFSDHTSGIKASVIASILGAQVIEKHFTLNRKLDGPDHSFSLEPKDFKKMVDDIIYSKKIMGDGKIIPSKKELSIRNKFRRSIVANQFIDKGTRINSDMLALRRPGTGLHPKMLKKVIGSKAKKKYHKNDKIII